MSENFLVRSAKRHAVPIIMSIDGVQFSGKTYGALMLASGLIKPGGKIGFIDTENGRGEMYADDPDVMKVIPQGYQYLQLHPPFHPDRYVAAIHQYEQMGIDLGIIDSGSHAWDGDGGCTDIAAEEKNRWQKAKLANKHLMSAIRYSPCHWIVCLRAQEKSKIVSAKDSPTKKEEHIPLGILPICEKSFPFELGLSFNCEGEIEGRPATHFARPRKYPKALGWLFDDWQGQLLTPEIGRRIREWNDGAPAGDATERLRLQAAATAAEGLAAYQRFWKSLTAAQRKALEPYHAANKLTADEADHAKEQTAREADIPEVDKLGDAVPLPVGTRVRFHGEVWETWESPEGFDWRMVA